MVSNASARLTFLIGLSATLLAGCQSSTQTDTSAATYTPPTETQLTGEQLSQSYCGSCHLTPAPSLLDKATWQAGVLPQMALRMGQSDKQLQVLSRLDDADELQRIVAANIFPQHPTLHPADWQKIVQYYVAKAPDRLPAQPAHPPVLPTLPLFRARQSTHALDAFVTLLRYDSVSHRTWAGDGRGQLYALDKSLHRVDSVRLGSPPTDLYRAADGSLNVLTAGVLNPNDQTRGTLARLATSGKPAKALVDRLQRPVQATPADLNRDGRMDVVLCQFGNYTGKLTWHEQRADGTYQEHVLDALPGARVAQVRDINRDGRPDVVALLTQGDEQVAMYVNQPDGTFQKKTLLRFPSVYGSSYVELADIDRDGDEDILYTNGDNADYSIILKPYHGLRIFLNNGQFGFHEAWFFPMYGASQTVVRDFDQDGDLDIAAIAQFPDFGQRPNQGFVYFENTGNLHFTPRTFAGAERGRWLCLDAGDVDQDGDLDLLLGAFARPTPPEHAHLMEQWRKPGTGVMVLENTLRYNP